ncbi:hypothetical protein MJO28_015303, partial [Puccinia striiformis f. sp. tritici]
EPSRLNRHLTQHYSDDIQRFGPPQSIAAWAQEWVNGILQKVSSNNHPDTLCKSLSNKPISEQDFFASQSGSEILKNMPPPPFTPALIKGNVGRELSSAGISRMTFDWTVTANDESPWNSAVVEAIGCKSVGWLYMRR